MPATKSQLIQRLLPGSLIIDDKLIGRHAITDIVSVTWALPAEFLQKANITYFMRSWEGSHLEKQVSYGRIFYQGQYYNVVWHVTPTRAYRAPSVLLSFRGNDTYGRYVIIRIKGEY